MAGYNNDDVLCNDLTVQSQVRHLVYKGLQKVRLTVLDPTIQNDPACHHGAIIDDMLFFMAGYHF